MEAMSSGSLWFVVLKCACVVWLVFVALPVAVLIIGGLAILRQARSDRKH